MIDGTTGKYLKVAIFVGSFTTSCFDISSSTRCQARSTGGVVAQTRQAGRRSVGERRSDAPARWRRTPGWSTAHRPHPRAPLPVLGRVLDDPLPGVRCCAPPGHGERTDRRVLRLPRQGQVLRRQDALRHQAADGLADRCRLHHDQATHRQSIGQAQLHETHQIVAAAATVRPMLTMRRTTMRTTTSDEDEDEEGTEDA